MTDTFTKVKNYLFYSDGKIIDEAHKTTTRLNLGSCEIGSDDVIAIAKALEKNTTLTSINLLWNSMVYESARLIAQALSSNIFILLEDSVVASEAEQRVIDQIHKRNREIRDRLERQPYFANTSTDDLELQKIRGRRSKSLQQLHDQIPSGLSQQYLAVLLDADHGNPEREKDHIFPKKIRPFVTT